MRAGQLRHRVRIETLVHSLDEDGASTEAWTDVIGVGLSASIAPLSGRELFLAASTQSEVTTRIVIRYRPEVTSTMRVVHRETAYNIESVLPDPDSGIRKMTLLCTSGVAV